jgi:hypothetical protein
MALTRRAFLMGLPALAGPHFGCSPGVLQRSDGAPDSLLFASDAAPGAPRVLVCMPETRQTTEVLGGLSDELGRELEVVALRTEGDQVAANIARGIQLYHPSALVLMNNPTVEGYRRLQATRQDTAFPPAVIVMSSFLEGRPSGLRETTGISYEVPLITLVTNLRKLIATPIDRVGVIHRPGFDGFVARQAALARREQTAVAAEEVGREPNASEIKRALRRLKQRCDAIWVLNDDRLLTPRLLSDGWLRGVHEHPWLPTIVGAASLVSPSQSFGTFAVLPDHTALGTQAANLIVEIAGNGWSLPPKATAQLPLSTTIIIDLAQARSHFALRPNALAQVDRIMDR